MARPRRGLLCATSREKKLVSSQPPNWLDTMQNSRDELHQTEEGSSSTKEQKTAPPSKRSWYSPPRRYVVACLAFFGFWNVYALRVNLSVAIVAMTSNYTVQLANGTEIQQRDFDWDSRTRGLLLSSFFWGYLVTQVPGGWLSARYGGALLYASGIAATALLTLLTPLAAHGGVTVLFALRVIEGLFEGVTYPCIHAVWSRWAPPLERSKLATIAFSGSYVGTVISMPLSGYLAKHAGWPWVFYVFGCIGLVWYAVWIAVVREGPEKDPHISPEELAYIQESLGKQPDKRPIPPWKEFLKSPCVWAIVVAHFNTLDFDLKDAGLLSALPYLVMAVVLQIAGQMADCLRSRKILSTTNVRKLFTCFGFLSQTVFMLLTAYLLAPAAAVTCLTIAFASVLMGISNTVATLPGIISPALTGVIIVFYLAGTIYLVGAVTYAIFASGERQSWAPAVEDTPTVAPGEQAHHPPNYNSLYGFSSGPIALEEIKLPRPKLNT
ncbi:hypothetical protein B566_EDAN014321 [Ephemera danica]|nr:hypothetical protein B566_EDAN014321 [Ephemera danica]